MLCLILGGIIPLRLVVFVVVALVIWFMLAKTTYDGIKLKLILVLDYFSNDGSNRQ